MGPSEQSDEAPITPIPVPKGAERVMLFGGTFDPVHRGHVGAAGAARDLVMGTDGWLVFVPAARSPFKAGGPEAGDAERVEMLELALAMVPRAGIWQDELGRPAPSYWIDTMRRARAVLGAGVDLRFLIGADAALAFAKWREWREIIREAEPVVMARPPLRSVSAFAAALAGAGWSASEVEWWRARFVAGAVIDISATDVRTALRSGDPRAARWLDPAVLSLIRRKGLYRRG